jgi:DNA gyrase/topoisomerase IV subunit A
VAAYSDEVTLVSGGGKVLRTAVDDIPRMGRATRGAGVMELKNGSDIGGSDE